MPFLHKPHGVIHYDVLGNIHHPAVILLAGAGRPATDYDAIFCDPFLAAGYCLVRVDQRDTGASSACGEAVDLHAIKAAALGMGDAKPPYDIADMAQDVADVMDALSIASAHFVGRSIGGLVAQQLAISQPQRVRSLMLIMAMSRSLVDVISDAVLDRLMAEHVPDEEAYAARQILVAKANAMAEDYDAERIDAEARAAWRRGFHAGGTARHFAACLAAPDLREGLAAVNVPTLIVHGRHDKTIPLAYARESAAAIAGSVLMIDDRMAHDGPPRLRQKWATDCLNFLG